MDLGIKGKTAFVAAASDGLGKAVALRLAAEGANVVICARNEERIRAALKEIELASPEVSARDLLPTWAAQKISRNSVNNSRTGNSASIFWSIMPGASPGPF